MAQRRCLILIDGSNFFFKLRDLGLHHLINFDFAGFAKMLAGEGRVVRSVYYVGAVRTDGSEKSKQMLAYQQKILAHLKKSHFNYSLGFLLKSDDHFHEKGVDVKFAVDMLVATYEDLCDHIVLVSSDTDLLPAVQKAKEKRKTVEYVGFSHYPSVAMVARCSESRLLKKEDLEPFVHPKTVKTKDEKKLEKIKDKSRE